MFPELNETKFWSHFTPPTGILQTRMNGWRTPWKKILKIINYKNKYQKTVRAQKVDQKMGSFALFSFFSPDLWSLNCPK